MSNDVLPCWDGPDGASFHESTGPVARVLVAEDEAVLRRLLTVTLREAGYDVETTEDGQEAWEAWQKHPYDLVITDQNMPRMTGLDLIERLHEAHFDPPVIMVSATMPKEEFQRHPELRPAATLMKPYTIAEVLQTVKATLRAHFSASHTHGELAGSSAWPA